MPSPAISDAVVPRRRTTVPATAAWAVVACAVVGGGLTVVPPSGRPDVSGAVHAATLVLSAGALGLAVFACARHATSARGFLGPFAAALGAALALGWLAAPADWDRSRELGVFLGLVACATTALVLQVIAAEGPYARMLRSVGGWFAVAALALAGTLYMGWPASAYAAAIAASTPLLMRALPALGIGVADEELLDHSVLMKLRWAVRSPIPTPPGPIENDRVHAFVRAGSIQRSVGTTLLCLSLVPAMALVATGAATSTTERIATVVLAATLVVFLVLAPRTSRSALERWLPRVTAVIVAAETLVLWLPRVVHDGPTVNVAVILVVVGAVLALTVIPVGGGARSLGLSRTGDRIEAVAVFLVVPAGFVAGGFIELIRGLVG